MPTHVTLEKEHPAPEDPRYSTPRIFSVRGTTFEGLRTLSPDEYAEYRESRGFLQVVREGKALAHCTQINLRDLVAAYETLDTLAEDDREARRSGHHVALNVNRCLANYLSSFRLFLDYTQLRLTRTYGKDSEQLSAFKAICSKLYDEHFSYRFLYRLRNFSQHCGMPIGHVSTVGSIRDDPDGDPVFDVEVCFKVDELVSIGGDLWGPVRKDLETQPRLLDVGPIVAENASHVVSIYKGLLPVERTELVQAAVRVSKLLQEVGTGGRPTVGWYEDHDGLIGIAFKDPPYAFIQEVFETFEMDASEGAAD